MAVGLNKVQIIGNLGEDIELHYYDKDNCVARFNVATTETYISKKNGERIQHTEWHKIVVKNKLAIACETYLSKGDLIYIEGKLRTKYIDTQTAKKKETQIVTETIKFLKTKKTLSSSDSSN